VLRKEPTLIEEYVKDGTMKLQFRHILDHGNSSIQASAAAECAGQQGAFWKMHDLLFENGDSLQGADITYFNDLAASLEMDVEWFQECMDSGEMQARVKLVDQEAKAEGIRVRPTFVIMIDGEEAQRLQGSPTLDQWRQTLDDLIQ
jgi:protein-disulfide isomerase